MLFLYEQLLRLIVKSNDYAMFLEYRHNFRNLNGQARIFASRVYSWKVPCLSIQESNARENSSSAIVPIAVHFYFHYIELVAAHGSAYLIDIPEPNVCIYYKRDTLYCIMQRYRGTVPLVMPYIPI